MNADSIKMEIIELQKTRLEWARTKMTKMKAQELVNKIGVFEHTFSVNFPIAKKYFQTDPFVKVKFLDGKEELEYYSNSNLEKKDDEYFRNGVKHLNQALSGIIRGLESKNSDLK